MVTVFLLKVWYCNFLSPSEHPKVTRSLGFKETQSCKNSGPESANFRPCCLSAPSVFGGFVLRLGRVNDVPSGRYNFPHISLHSVRNLFLVLLILRNSAPLNVWGKRWSPISLRHINIERTNVFYPFSFVSCAPCKLVKYSARANITLHRLHASTHPSGVHAYSASGSAYSASTILQVAVSNYWGPAFLLLTPLVMTTVCFMIAGSVTASDHPRRRHQAAQKFQHTSAKRIW